MHISELMNPQDLEVAIESGLISKRKHPIHPLYILNYTAAAQFDWVWNDVTLNCRGLVVDEDYNIIARSFPKFFSYEQLDGKLPEGEFVVEEKLDGSMLLVFRYKDEVITATRGSFESEQAIKAQDFLKGFNVKDGESWIFEIIYKENRIVVDYDFEGLVLLDVNDLRVPQLKATANILNTYAEWFCFRRPKVYSFNSLEDKGVWLEASKDKDKLECACAMGMALIGKLGVQACTKLATGTGVIGRVIDIQFPEARLPNACLAKTVKEKNKKLRESYFYSVDGVVMTLNDNTKMPIEKIVETLESCNL